MGSKDVPDAIVFGAVELRHLMEVIQRQPHGGLLAGYPENLLDLNPNTLIEWGAAYVQQLRQHHPTAKRITDKMPANYLGLGLIPLLLPRARIVHVKRNPIDTCVSLFYALVQPAPRCHIRPVRTRPTLRQLCSVNGPLAGGAACRNFHGGPV